MKIKERALAILLSLVMMLAFMPALAFANDEEPDANKPMLTAQEVTEDDATSIEFSPSYISLYSEDIKETEPDGTFFYSFYNRATTVFPDGTRATYAFAKGDRLTVHYNDGSTVVYTATVEYFEEDNEYDLWFTDKDGNRIWPGLVGEDESLKAGDNKVAIYYGPAQTTISVYMDTPELRAQRAAKEAARQGTPDRSLPKVKITKPKPAKKAATIKWKKLNKKQLKKSKAQKIEV